VANQTLERNRCELRRMRWHASETRMQHTALLIWHYIRTLLLWYYIRTLLSGSLKRTAMYMAAHAEQQQCYMMHVVVCPSDPLPTARSTAPGTAK
jgi:hypothetical protein